MKKIIYDNRYLLTTFEGIDFYIRFFQGKLIYAELIMQVGNTHIADYALEVWHSHLGTHYRIIASYDDCGFNSDLQDELDEAFEKLMQTHKF